MTMIRRPTARAARVPAVSYRLRRWLVAAVVAGLAAGPGMATAEPPLRLLAFGDSLIHGYGLPAGATFPVQLQAALRARGFAVEIVNGGNSGDTTASARARLAWSLSPRPDLALVELGGNDGLRGLDPAATYENLEAILTEFAAAGVPVLLAGMLAPRNLGSDFATEFDAIFPQLAARRDVAFYPFFLDGVALRPELNQADGIHPNEAGVAVIVERILPSVIQLIVTSGKDATQTRGAPADG
jgi:acyl-CoA thioesterase-1